MGKERKSNKETKKMPGMTPKEKKAAKRARKNGRGRVGELFDPCRSFST